MNDFEQARHSFLAHLVGLKRSAHNLDAYGRDVAQFGRFLQEQAVVSLADVNPGQATFLAGWRTWPKRRYPAPPTPVGSMRCAASSTTW